MAELPSWYLQQEPSFWLPDAAAADTLSFFVRGMLAYVEERIARDQIPSAMESTDVFENGMPEILKRAFYCSDS